MMVKFFRLFPLFVVFVTACANEVVPTRPLISEPNPTESSYPAPIESAVVETAVAYPVAIPTVTEQTYPTATETIPHYTYAIINTYPHDPTASTQGLILEDNFFYEGTGLYGESTLRKVDVNTGEVLEIVEIPEQYFGEGITIFDDRIIQLTWREHVGFVYDQESFEQIQTFNYPTEGWGITHDGEQLIMSDGTNRLYFWDPETLAETGFVDVFDENRPVERLNELEYIDGEVWANVWQTDSIVRINPDTGQIVGWIDLAGLLNPADVTQPVGVLNGIAFDETTDRLFITGKRWPKLFEIELIPLN